MTQLDRLIRRLSLGYRVRIITLALAEEALAAALIVAVAAWLLKGQWVYIATACAVLLTLRAGWLWLRTRFDVRQADLRLGLREQLTTWLALHRRAEGPVVEWLARDLEAQLAADPGALGRVAAARRLRPLRAVLPLLVALLLLMLFFPPLPEGVLELPNAGVASADAPVEGGGAKEPQPIDREPEPAPDAPPDRPDPPPPEAEPEPEPPPDESPEPDPKALLDDPQLQDAVTIPQFVGEGEGTLSTMPVAALDEGDIAPPPPASGAPTPSATPDGSPPPDEPDPAVFERALERALRARTVPEAERPFVRRWFTSLVDAAK